MVQQIMAPRVSKACTMAVRTVAPTAEQKDRPTVGPRLSPEWRMEVPTGVPTGVPTVARTAVWRVPPTAVLPESPAIKTVARMTVPAWMSEPSAP